MLAQSTAYHDFLQNVRYLNEELQSAKRKDVDIDELETILKVSYSNFEMQRATPPANVLLHRLRH